MSHRPFKKRDWDAELARLGVPSDSPMRLIQRNGNAVGDEANNDIVAASEEDGAAAGTDAGGDIGTPDAASENAGGGGGARRGWSPARPFDLGADRSPFLTDVAPSPKDDDDHQPDELRRWKPGATPLAVGGMLGDVYGETTTGKTTATTSAGIEPDTTESTTRACHRDDAMGERRAAHRLSRSRRG